MSFPIFLQSQMRHQELPVASWYMPSCGGSLVLAWRAASLGRAQRAVLAKVLCPPPLTADLAPSRQQTPTHLRIIHSACVHIGPAPCLSTSAILLAVRSQSEGRITRNVPSYVRSHCPPFPWTALCRHLLCHFMETCVPAF